MRTGSLQLAFSLAVAVTIDPTGGGPAQAWAYEVPAGRLGNLADAMQNCPLVCQPGKWTGQWRTPGPNQSSVCQCDGVPVGTSAPPAGAWPDLPSRASDIGVGANGAVWAIGTKRVSGGYAIYSWNNSTWTEVAGGGVHIAVAPDGTPWVVDLAGRILQRTGDSWQPLPGKAKDLSIGANGAMWAIGTKPVPGGYNILSWNGASWQESPGGAVQIAVAPDGMPWIVNSSGQIYRWVGNSWQLQPATAKDIGIGADGNIWIVGTKPVPGGFGIYQWNGVQFVQQKGAGTHIAVGPTGIPQIVNDAGRIFGLASAAALPSPPRVSAMPEMPPMPPVSAMPAMPAMPKMPPLPPRFFLVSASGTCIDAEAPDFRAQTSGGPLQARDCSGGPSQQFRFEGGAIVSSNGQCLDVPDPDFQTRPNGSRVWLWDCNGSPNQQWSVSGLALVSANGKCLDQNGPDFAARTSSGGLQLWDCFGGANQQWSVQRQAAPVPPVAPIRPRLAARATAGVYVPSQPGPQFTQPGVMPNERFATMLEQVNQLGFIDEKIQRMQDYLPPATRLTTQQVAQLMQTAGFGSERIRIAVMLWPRVLDPENFPDLVGLLSFESERQELRQKLGR